MEKKVTIKNAGDYFTKNLATGLMPGAPSFPEYKRAIVVLGGPNQDKRLEKGLSEYRKDPYAMLMISGFGKDLERNSERIAKNSGLDSILIDKDSADGPTTRLLTGPFDNILIDNKSRNTKESAINSIYNIKRSFPNVEKITIVSDYVHQPRSEMLFKRYSGGDYNIDFSGVKTDNKLYRVIYELCAFPLSMIPYSIHEKLAKVFEDKLLYSITVHTVRSPNFRPKKAIFIELGGIKYKALSAWRANRKVDKLVKLTLRMLVPENIIDEYYSKRMENLYESKFCRYKN